MEDTPNNRKYFKDDIHDSHDTLGMSSSAIHTSVANKLCYLFSKLLLCKSAERY